MVFGAVYAVAARLLYDPLRELQGTAHYVLADGSLEPNPSYRRVPPRPGGRGPTPSPSRGSRRADPPSRPSPADPSRLDFVVRPEAFPALWERLTRGS